MPSVVTKKNAMVAIMQKPLFSTLLLFAALLRPAAAYATMTIRGYDDAKHERYYTGGDRAFIGEPYDWSGVGKSSNRWAVMISDHFFLSCMHVSTPSPVYFYEGNSAVEEERHEYAINNTVGTRRIASSDLRLGMFTTPVDASIAKYPILVSNPLLMNGGIEDFTDDQFDQVLAPYANAMLYNYGQGNRVGRNVLDYFLLIDGGNDDRIPTMYFQYDDPGVGDDETHLQSGDSGGPTFFIHEGQLSLSGIHWYINADDYPTGSGDSFVPGYVFEIQAAMDAMADSAGIARESLSLDYLYAIPEPAMSLILLTLTTTLLLRRNHRTNRRSRRSTQIMT